MNNDFISDAKEVLKIPVIDLYDELESSPEEKEKELVRLRSYFDLKFFCTYFFSHLNEENKMEGHASDPFNKFHKEYFKDFSPKEEGVRRVFMASRGSAKTTLMCLFDTIHRCCYGTEKYILVLSSTTPLARGKVQDIHNEVTNNEKLRNFFGLDFAHKIHSKEKFLVKSYYGDCYIHSIGFFGQLRGIKFGSQRPTRIILDDVTHSEHVHSETQREKNGKTAKN